MIRHVLDTSTNSCLNGVIVVVNPDIAGLQQEVWSSSVNKIVLNDEAGKGMSTSLKAGVTNLPSTTDAAVVLLGDQPLVTADDINEVIQCYLSNEALIVQAQYQSKRGHPVLFDHSMFPHLFHITGDEGARSILKQFANQICLAEMDKPYPDDVDTPKDYEELLRKEVRENESIDW